MTTSFWNNPIVHGIVTMILFVLPTIIAQGGSWQSITLGGILAAIVKILQNKSANLTVAGNRKPY